MKKWTAAIYLAVLCGIFTASGIACGATSGCMFTKDKPVVDDGSGDENFDDDFGDGGYDDGGYDDGGYDDGGNDDGGSTSALAKPVVTLDGNLAVWEAVEGAVGYEYEVTQDGKRVASDLLDEDTTYFALYHGQEFRVRALGKEQGNESDWTDKIAYTAPNTLATPTVTIDKKGFASWAPVPNATKYEYMITGEDGEFGEVTTDIIEKTVMDFALKVNETITVRALGDNILYASGDYSAPKTCTSIDNSSTDVEGNDRPEDVVTPPSGGTDVEFDESKLGNMLNYKATFTAEVGEKANIPMVYVQYGDGWLEAFPWVTCGNEKVDVGGRGTRFYVDSLDDHIIDYYVDYGGVHKIASTTVTIQDTKGPTFDLPASADGMLVYKDEAAALPDWTAFDYSGIQGGTAGELTSKNGVTISVKDPKGTPVTVNNGKFTPTQFGKYTVTYSASDTKGNKGSTTFVVECARMVEVCDFDSLEKGWAWQYYNGEETIGELSTEHRYGDEGYSLKVTTRGTGEGGFIKVVAIPNYFDLSGFDELAFTIYSSETLQGTSAGIYILNNEWLYNQPYNLDKGENIVRVKISDFAKDYAGGKILNAKDVYKNADHIWLQFRGPKGVDLYIDNMVGVFYEETGSDREAPILDLGAGAAIAESKIEDVATYKGIYGNISVAAGDTIKSAIDKHVHVCDNSMGNIATTYKVTLNGADVTTEVMNGTRKGTFGETYNLTVTARDASGNNVTKSTTIVVRQKFPTYTKVGMEEITLNYGDDVNAVKMESNFSKVELKNQIDKNGKIQVRTAGENEVMWLKLTIPDKTTGERRALTVADVNSMEYINIKLLSHDPGAEISLGNNVQLCRTISGWNNITIDKATLIAAMGNTNAYNATTGELKLNIYCALALPYKFDIAEVKAVYVEGTSGYEKELAKLGTPQVKLDVATGVATWEAVDNAVSYTVFVNGVEVGTQNTLTYTLQDEQKIEVRANGDKQNYDNSANSIPKTYYKGKVLLNNCEDLIYFDGPTKELSDQHVKEGNSSVKITSVGNWQTMTVYMRIDDKALSKAQWQEYEYVELSIYSETEGMQLYIVSDPTIKMTPVATLTKGENVVKMYTKDILDAMDAFASAGSSTQVYSTGFLFVQFPVAGTVYFDKIMGVIGNGSAYVPPQSGGDEGEEEETGVIGMSLNNCDEAGGWIASNATYDIDTTIKTQGAASIKVDAKAWNYINIYVRDYTTNNEDGAPMHLSKAKLMEYDFFYMDVCNGGSTDVDLYMKDQTTVKATLKAGAWTQISFSKEDVATWFEDNAAGTYGAYNTFYVLQDAVLYFDNVKGCMKADNPDFVIGGNQSSGGNEGDEPTTPSVMGAMFNNCEVVQHWVASNGTVSLDSTIKTQGSYSVKVQASANNYIVINLRNQTTHQPIPESELLSYDYLYLDVYNAEAGPINLFIYNALVAELAPGWNQVKIPKALIQDNITQSNAASGPKQYIAGEFYFAVYANCTLYFDNVQGCND